jgi:hypothetical protein
LETGGTCEKFVTAIQIYVIGAIENSVLKNRIQEAFEIFQANIVGLEGVLVFDTAKIDVELDEGFNKAIKDTNATDDGGEVATIVGGAAAALACMLLLILLIRRNRTSDDVSHLKLEDEGDDTFIKEFGDTATNPSDYETRNAHVIGEADSIFSGWTGYSPKQRHEDDVDAILGKLGQETGDVHKCSSATCEICEASRQGGVQFVPTGTPPRPEIIPSDASREYLADDTVEL